MTLLDRIVQDGKLPEIETNVSIGTQSLIDMALAIIIAAVIIMLIGKLIKWL